MTTTYLGSLTVGGVMPGGVAVGVAGAAGIGAALPSLLDQLATLLASTPQLVSFEAQISGLQLAITGLQQSIAFGLAPPSLDLQLAALAAMIAALQALISGINAELDIIHAFQSALSAAGVHAIAYAGAAGALGSEVESRLSTVPGVAPGDACNALLLVSTIPATWAALAQILKVTP